MNSARERTRAYRKEAELCMELAQRMAVATYRARLIEVAQLWLHLAERDEAKPDRGDDLGSGVRRARTPKAPSLRH